MPDLNDFYVLDGIAAAVVLLSAWIAYLRGFVRELFSLATWIGAVVATAYFYPQASTFVRQHIETQLAADLAAGVGVFFVWSAARLPRRLPVPSTTPSTVLRVFCSAFCAASCCWSSPIWHLPGLCRRTSSRNGWIAPR